MVERQVPQVGVSYLAKQAERALEMRKTTAKGSTFGGQFGRGLRV